MFLMAKAENYFHTNNGKKKLKEKCQIEKFPHFQTITFKVTLAPKNSIFRKRNYLYIQNKTV